MIEFLKDNADTLAMFLPFLLVGTRLPWWQRVCQKAYAIPQGAKGPLGGGWLLIGVVTLFFCILSFTPAHTLPASFAPNLFMIFLLIATLGIAVAALSLKLDKTNTPPNLWFWAMFCVFVGLGAMVIPPLSHALPFWLDRAVLVAVWFFFIRGFIVADRLDGLATLSAALLALGLSIFAKPLGLVCLILTGACLAFIRFNRPKALLLLGHAGRHWLGFVMGGLWLLAATQASTSNLGAFLILPLVLWLNPFLSQTPWHQRAQRAGLTDTQTLVRTLGLQVFLLVLALVEFASSTPLGLLGLALFTLGCVAVRIKWLENKTP